MTPQQEPTPSMDGVRTRYFPERGDVLIRAIYRGGESSIWLDADLVDDLVEQIIAGRFAALAGG